MNTSLPGVQWSDLVKKMQNDWLHIICIFHLGRNSHKSANKKNLPSGASRVHLQSERDGYLCGNPGLSKRKYE